MNCIYVLKYYIYLFLIRLFAANLQFLKSHVMKIVVVGNGMVGYKFCEKLIAKNTSQQIEITVFGEETRPAYDRVHLSEFFAGKSADDLSMAPADWYASNNIALHLGDPVQHIDRINKIVHSHLGHNSPLRLPCFSYGFICICSTYPRCRKRRCIYL